MKELNKFLVFPYENHIENILKSLEDKMYGRVEDILTLNGWWVKTKPEIHVGNKEIKIKKNIDELLSNYVEKINRPLNSFSKQYQEHFSLQHFSQFEQFYLSTKQMMNNLSGLIFIGLDISIFSDVNISYLNSLEQVSKIEVELINSLHTVMSFKNTTSLKLISSR